MLVRSGRLQRCPPDTRLSAGAGARPSAGAAAGRPPGPWGAPKCAAWQRRLKLLLSVQPVDAIQRCAADPECAHPRWLCGGVGPAAGGAAAGVVEPVEGFAADCQGRTPTIFAGRRRRRRLDTAGEDRRGCEREADGRLSVTVDAGRVFISVSWRLRLDLVARVPGAGGRCVGRGAVVPGSEREAVASLSDAPVQPMCGGPPSGRGGGFASGVVSGVPSLGPPS
jgi:hypothetical protein